MLKVSVSGVRGIVGKSLTPRVALEFGLAFGTFIKGTKVAIGRDTRTTGILLRNAVVCGLESCGCEVIDFGICPTPTVLLTARKLKCDAIVITASHNPAEWNGLKFVKKDGTFLNKMEMKSLFNIYKNRVFNVPIECEETDRVARFDKAIDFHIDTVIRNIDRHLIRRRAFRVACDFCNGTGAVITKKFLKKLGCRVYTINDKPDGRFAHDPEPVAENLSSLSKLVKRKRADFGLAQDPDADRLSLCDEKGNIIGEENTLSLAVKAILIRKKGRVVVNISTSKAIDKITEELGAELFRTPVGEINVVERMREVDAVIGGEGNGGIIYPKINLCRDSLVGSGIIMEYLARTKTTLSNLVSQIHQYKMVKGKFHCPTYKMKSVIRRLKTQFRDKELILRDGIKILWPEGWVHVRASNTEPIVRIIAEAKTTVEARKLYNLVKKNIKG